MGPSGKNALDVALLCGLLGSGLGELEAFHLRCALARLQKGVRGCRLDGDGWRQGWGKTMFFQGETYR